MSAEFYAHVEKETLKQLQLIQGLCAEMIAKQADEEDQSKPFERIIRLNQEFCRILGSISDLG